MEISLKEIGRVCSSRSEIKDDHWDSESTHIELASDYPPESLFGLSDFSHVEVLFYMDQVKPDKIEKSARHPRGREDWPRVGIFAQRGKNRPNQIGLTICRIKEVAGNNLFLEGLDAVDGTPILDIKPWVKEFGPRGAVSQPHWISELMQNYWS